MEYNKEELVNNPTDTLLSDEQNVVGLVEESNDALKRALSEKDAFAPYKEDEGEQSTEEITSRTLSPGRIVLKRFFRSKLSMTGLIMLIVLFVFSFLGPFLPFSFIWGEDEADNSQKITEEYTTLVDAPTYGEDPVYIVKFSEPTNYPQTFRISLVGYGRQGLRRILPFDVRRQSFLDGRLRGNYIGNDIRRVFRRSCRLLRWAGWTR